MALYGGSRDISLLRRLNKELINDIINSEVILYKISIENTEIDIYGDSIKSEYFNPIKINCLISRDDKVYQGEDIVDYSNQLRLYFLRDELVEKDTVIKEGDAIKWDGDYYEITTVSGNQLWLGKNPATVPITVDDNSDEFGYNVAVTVIATLTTPDKLGLADIRPAADDFYDLNDLL